MIHPYLPTRVWYVLCTTYVQSGISSYVPGMSRLPRYVHVDTSVPGLHTKKKKGTEGLLMKFLQKNKIKINNRNTELCHHRPRSKAHSNEYENNADKAEQSLPAWRGAGRSSRGTKPLLSSSDGARSCRITLRCMLLYCWKPCLLYTSPSPRDQRGSRMPSSA